MRRIDGSHMIPPSAVIPRNILNNVNFLQYYKIFCIQYNDWTSKVLINCILGDPPPPADQEAK